MIELECADCSKEDNARVMVKDVSHLKILLTLPKDWILESQGEKSIVRCKACFDAKIEKAL